MEYTQYNFITTQSELLLALIQDLPFDSFETLEDQLRAYIPTQQIEENLDEQLHDILEGHQVKWTKKLIPYQNWNEIWESNFSPILVRNFCGIKANFHPSFESAPQHVIHIQPKMAFGTGHHATTWMMIDAMRALDFKNKKVFDYGCGTSILAILAAKMGASHVDAIDIEKAAVENSLEHLSLNNTENIFVKEATLDSFEGQDYDITLANINRNVILDSLSSLYQRLKSSAFLLISGFIQEDKNLMTAHLKKHNFELVSQYSKDNWVCLLAQKGN